MLTKEGSCAIRQGWRREAARRWRPAAGLLAAVLVLVVAAKVLSPGSLTTAAVVVVAILFATSSNLLIGTGGIPTFGQAAFYGTGAYTVGTLAARLSDPLITLLVATGFGAALGLLMSLFVFRVRGLAFVMVTLAVAQIMYTALLQNNLFGGYDGLAGILPGSIAGWSVDSVSATWFLIGGVVIVAMAVLRWVDVTPFTRAVTALREDSARALYLGIELKKVQTTVMVIAAAGTALAGGLSAYATTTVSPDSLYWTTSAAAVVMCVLGGRRRFWGPAIGAVVYTIAVQELSGLWIWYYIPLGAGIVLVIMAMPRGLIGTGQDWLREIAGRLRPGWGRALGARVGGPDEDAGRAVESTVMAADSEGAAADWEAPGPPNGVIDGTS